MTVEVFSLCDRRVDGFGGSTATSTTGEDVIDGIGGSHGTRILREGSIRAHGSERYQYNVDVWGILEILRLGATCVSQVEMRYNQQAFAAGIDWAPWTP